MRSKGAISKSVSVIVAVSMIGMGTAPSIPKAFAASPDVSQAIETNALSQLEIVKSDGTVLDENLSTGTYQYSATVENNIDSMILHLKGTNENTPISVAKQNAADASSTAIALNGDGRTAAIPLDPGDNTIMISVGDGSNLTQYTLKVTREVQGSGTDSTAGTSTNNGSSSTGGTSAGDGTSTGGTSSTGETSTTGGTSSTGTSATGGTSSTGTSASGESSSTGTSTTVSSSAGTETTGGTQATGSEPQTGKNISGATAARNPSFFSKKSSGYLSGLRTMSANNQNNKFPGNMNGSSDLWGQLSQQGADASQKPSTATLSALSVSTGTWNKTFSKEDYTYHIAVGSDVDSVTISDTPTYSSASVTINGGTSNAVELGNQPKTIVPIVVTNGSDRKTYVLVFDKNIPQQATTAANTTTADQTATVETTSIDSSKASSASAPTNFWNNRNSSNVPTSWWSRFIDAIRSFFSKL